MAVHSQQFTTSGALRELTSGEVFSGKGMLSCRIMTPNGPLLFVTTHVSETIDCVIMHLVHMVKLELFKRYIEPCARMSISVNLMSV